MTVFEEGDLQIAIDNALDARRFDDTSHGLSHCMKAVDFIVELSDRYLFIEFKDPEHPMSRQEDRQAFQHSFDSGEIDEDLKYKYRDSFLYEWAAGRANKPVWFYVLVAIEELTTANLQARTEGLRRKLPVSGPSTWTLAIVQDCSVFNISSWNQHFPRFPVRRISSSLQKSDPE